MSADKVRLMLKHRLGLVPHPPIMRDRCVTVRGTTIQWDRTLTVVTYPNQPPWWWRSSIAV